MRFSGVATGNLLSYRFETTTQIVATAGQAWNESLFAQIVAQPNPAVAYNIQIIDRTAIGGQIAVNSVPISVTSALNRFDANHVTAALTERIQPNFTATLVVGQSYDFTIRIGLPQMEQGAFASSVMKTSSGAFTRPIDAIEDTGAPELTTGGLYALADLRLLNQTRTIKASGTNASNGYFLLVTSTNRIRMEVRVSGVVTGSVETRTITAGLRKVAGLWTPSGIALYVDGVAIGTAVPSSLPASTATTSIGSDFGAVALFDRLTLCGVINDELTNSQAIALTT
jgi:hypothetical protein